MKDIKTPRILYEDNHLIVAIKPPGVLSQAGEKDLPDMLTILKMYLKEKYDKPGNVFLGLVHRLDLNVGGVMVFAKTSKAAKRLFDSITSNQFHKEYVAVVEGSWSGSKEGRFDDWIVKDEEKRTAKISSSDEGTRASLTFRVVSEFEQNKIPCSGVLIQLETGRFHQIRKQFSHHGHPLWGDTKYGAQSKEKEIALWAYRLSFPHPVSQQTMTFEDFPKSPVFSSMSHLDHI